MGRGGVQGCSVQGRTVLPQVHAGTGLGPKRLTTAPRTAGDRSFAWITRGCVRGWGHRTQAQQTGDTRRDGVQLRGGCGGGLGQQVRGKKRREAAKMRS